MARRVPAVAVLATRSGYVLTLVASPATAGTRLAIQGRQGGQPLDPARFDPLLAAIQARLATASPAP